MKGPRSIFRTLVMHGRNGDLASWFARGTAHKFTKHSHSLRALELLARSRNTLSTVTCRGFSWFDKWLWACGQTWPLPSISVCGAIGDFDKLRIRDTELFWPRGMEQRGLAWVYQEIFMSECRNPHAYELPGFRLKRGQWALDVGACEGFFALQALQRGASVVAFEAMPAIAVALAHTLHAYTLGKQASVVQCIVGDSDGDGWLQLAADPFQACSGTHGSPVPKWALDSLWKSGAFPRVDFLKIDVEGGEQAVLKGARELIQQCRPCIAAAVYHTAEQAEEVRDVLLSIAPDYKIKFRGLGFTQLAQPVRVMMHAQPRRKFPRR